MSGTDVEYAPDGSPVEVFARLGAGASPRAISALLPPGASILDLACGAGRISDPLAELGHDVLGVDQSAEMLARVQKARTLCARIETLDLDERFAAVLLPSYLINEPDRGLARSLLAAAVRHAAPGGLVLVQRLDPVRGTQITAGPTMVRNGVEVNLQDIDIQGMLVTATSVYTAGDHSWSQRWTSLVLSDEDLAAELAAVGLEVQGPLGAGMDWIVARRVAGAEQGAPAGQDQGAHLYWNDLWGGETGRAPWSEAEPWVVETFGLLKEREAVDVLDLGCGPGRHALALAEAGFRTTAADLSETGLAVVEAEARKRGLTVRTAVADAVALPFPDASFDYVLAWNVVYHGDADRVRAAILEISRVLRPGGLYQSTMLSRRNTECGLGTEVSPGTYVQPDGDEDKAYPHHYCDIHGLLALHDGLDLLTASDVPHLVPGNYHWHLMFEKPLGEPGA